jgi:hypothetical protein
VNGGGSALAGGFCGTYTGGILEAIAKSIHGWICYRDTICNTGVVSLHNTIEKTFHIDNESIWATSVALQAIAHHTNIVYFGSEVGINRSGPGTETHLQEIGLTAIMCAVNQAGLYIVRQGRARMNGAQTPLEAEWHLEVAEAVLRTGLDVDGMTRVMHELIPLVNGKPVEPPQLVVDCYDLVRHEPKPAYKETYLKVKEQFSRAGLNFG